MAIDRSKIRSVQEPSLSLFPMMNLMCIMIPFLLTSTAFFHLAVIDTQAIVQAEEGPGLEAPEGPIPLDLSLMIGLEGFQLSSSQKIYEGNTQALIPKLGNGEYDFARLRDVLYAIKKDGHENSDTIYIGTAAGISYAAVITVLDYCRDIKLDDGKGGEAAPPPEPAADGEKPVKKGPYLLFNKVFFQKV